MPGLEIEVRALTDAGDPRTVRYRFAVPLEDPTLRWLRWRERTYEPFTPPELGASVTLAPGKGIFDP